MIESERNGNHKSKSMSSRSRAEEEVHRHALPLLLLYVSSSDAIGERERRKGLQVKSVPRELSHVDGALHSNKTRCREKAVLRL
jgi:hypothetical protein